jgi:hypothetical protein
MSYPTIQVLQKLFGQKPQKPSEESQTAQFYLVRPINFSHKQA